MTKKSQLENVLVTNEMRREHKPVSGALYRSRQNSESSSGIRIGDIVMVVSEAPHLVDKKYVYKTANGQEMSSVVQEWVDLVILWNEKFIDLDKAREHLWYYWFERVQYE